MLFSLRRGLAYPNPDRSDIPDIPAHIGTLITALEQDMMYGQGTFGARPISTPASPGIPGRIYVATDLTPHGFYYDYGTGWDPLAPASAPIPTFGTRVARPSAAAAGSGGLYYATDQVSAYLSDGTTWYRVSEQAGNVIWTMESAARPGYLIPSGQAWPATTGIYADLFAVWGGQYPSVLPDYQGRQFVARGTHADVNTIGFTDGIAAALRRIRHRHTFVGTAGTTSSENATHTHDTTVPAGGGQEANFASGSDAVALETPITVTSSGQSSNHQHPFTPAGTVGPQTGSEPTDMTPYITLVPQVKL
jgi:hypothetical protein